MSRTEHRGEDPVLLAELIVRHTRRHMPTRRVALESAYLPTSGPNHGSALLAALVAMNLPAVDDDERELLARLVRDARGGLSIPRIALRHRLQRDVHGLDRSRHRLLGEDGKLVIELDNHGAQVPQVLGAVMGAAWLPPSGRELALDALRRVVEGRWNGLSRDVDVRFVAPDMWDYLRPPLAASSDWQPGGPPEEEEWRGVAAEQRWAMEVLGLRADMDVERDDVNRRFRRMLRDAHPDSGGAAGAAASRIAELTEARTILLDLASSEVAAQG
jgi:hypothetical protein